MRKHLSVFALCIRTRLFRLLLLILAAAALSAAVFLALGLPKAWGDGFGPGLTVLWILFVAVNLTACLLCIGPGAKRSKTAYLLQRLQISERAFLLWDALTSTACFLLLYAAQILIVFSLALLYQKSAAYSLGPQGVFLMLARNSFLHGLLPFGEPAAWARNLLNLPCAGLSCAAAASALRNDRRAAAAAFSLVWMNAHLPVQLGHGALSCIWLFAVAITAAIAFGGAYLSAHNGTRRQEDEPDPQTP